MTAGAGDTPTTLPRELGTLGAASLGLGSMLGTGVFVGIGIAAGIAGPSAVLAIVLAAAVAALNGLSSAQLAANHPTSGGTYEYGHVLLAPWLGFSAGWLFLCAKSASAATAALGFAGSVLALAGVDGAAPRTAVAAGAVIGVVLLALSGIRRSSAANIAIVTVTIASLAIFVIAGARSAAGSAAANLTPFFPPSGGAAGGAVPRFLEAAALMFVAFTGYGRIATMGEEVREPRRTIPRAILVTIAVALALYAAVALVGIAAAGPARFGELATGTGAPLAAIIDGFGGAMGGAAGRTALAIGAASAMLGVLLNLVLGLSRVLLAMGRRGDAPALLARLDARGRSPPAAVLVAGGAILALALAGDIESAWSFSAFTVLVYYALTNLAALRLPRGARLFPPALAVAGLIGSLGLAFWVEPRIWGVGLGVWGAGLLGRALGRRHRGSGGGAASRA